jgi:hypothetical protein
MADAKKSRARHSLDDIRVLMQQVFQDNGNGEAVWNHLTAKFYDTPIYSKGDPHDSIYRLGQRDVILYIINCMFTASKARGNPEDE